jgi:predicted signal transduction protein with EAL and GGDEF domain
MIPGVMGGTEQLLREADIALYRAKRMGRNQVHAAPQVDKKTDSLYSLKAANL